MSLNVLVILHFVRSRFRCSCFRATLLTVLRTVYPIDRISSGLSSVLVPVVQRLDNAIHRINHYPVDKCEHNKPRYPLDK